MVLQYNNSDISKVLDYCKRVSKKFLKDRNTAEVEDLTGEVGLWIAENPKKFTEIESYKTFFYRFMVNILRSKGKNYKVNKAEKHKDVSTYFIMDNNEKNITPSSLTTYSNAEHKTDLKLLYTLLSDSKIYGKYIASNNKGISHLVYKDWLEGCSTDEIMKKYSLAKSSVSMNIKKAKTIINQFFNEEIYREGKIYRHGIKRQKL